MMSSAMAMLWLPTEIEVSAGERVLDDMVVFEIEIDVEYTVHDFTEQMKSLLK
jgi:hypothetical protein